MELKKNKKIDFFIAGIIALSYLLILLGTNNIGFTRDESFYYHFAKVYQNWFYDVEKNLFKKDLKKVLGKKRVVSTWKQNFEHPPIMKTLFGYFYRIFGKKYKKIRLSDNSSKIFITNLSKIDGFQKGSRATVFAPLKIGEKKFEKIATCTVINRSIFQAECKIDKPLKDLKEVCKEYDKNREKFVKGCFAVENSPLYFLAPVDSMRFAAEIFSALLLFFIYLMANSVFGSRLIGVFSSVAFGFIPRNFFHAHLLCFDVPITFMMFVTLYAYMKSEKSFKWVIYTSILFGLSILTKHNAFFIPITIFLYYLIANFHKFRLSRGNLVIPDFPKALIYMLPIGFLMFFLLWPKMWYDPFKAFSSYLGFHLHHEHYMQYFFGNVLEVPPFPVIYPFALTFFTVPAVILVMFFVGFYYFVTSTNISYKTKVFLIVNMLVPITLIALPNTPIFGGIKHWLLTIPFVCMISGYGIVEFSKSFKRLIIKHEFAEKGVAYLITLLGLLTAIFQTFSVHPYGTSYYNEFMGGIQGGAKNGMHRQFWGYASRGAIDFLNKTVPTEKKVYFQNTTYDAYRMYQDELLLRDDINSIGGWVGAFASVFHCQKSFSELEIKIQEYTGKLWNDFQVNLYGVPLINVYVYDKNNKLTSNSTTETVP